MLVVWVGHFDGSANPAFVGVQTAAPLFFQIVDSLRSQGLANAAPDSTGPLNLSRVSVCKASGDLPNEHCSDLGPTWFIPGKSPIKLSTLHRALWVHTTTGRAVCGPGPGVRREVFEHWGSDMLQLFAQARMPRRVPPAPPRCGTGGNPATASDDGPQIVAPLRGAKHVLRIGRGAGLNLRAITSRPGPVYWFADAAFLGSAPAGGNLAWQPPAAGTYTLTAVDADGAADTRPISVEFAP